MVAQHLNHVVEAGDDRPRYLALDDERRGRQQRAVVRKGIGGHRRIGEVEFVPQIQVDRLVIQAW